LESCKNLERIFSTLVFESGVECHHRFQIVKSREVAHAEIEEFFGRCAKASGLCKKGNGIVRGNGFEFHMEAAATQRINQVARLATGKDKSCQVRIGFHWATESLLADEWESVGIIDEDKANCIRASVNPLTEIGNLVADGVNAAILFTAQPEDTVDLKGCFRFQKINKIFEEGGLAGGTLAGEKEMGEVVEALADLLKERCLAEEAWGEGGARWRRQQTLLH
jgi:hypothetical protein